MTRNSNLQVTYDLDVLCIILITLNAPKSHAIYNLIEDLIHIMNNNKKKTKHHETQNKTIYLK